MCFQNSTFPLAIYGCLDTASRKLLWLRVWNKNCDPQLIGHWYLEHVMETKLIPAMIRVDKGTETGTMATIHAFLRRHHTDVTDPVDTVLYGPSTSNQVSKLISRCPICVCLISHYESAGYFISVLRKLILFVKSSLIFLSYKEQINPPYHLISVKCTLHKMLFIKRTLPSRSRDGGKSCMSEWTNFSKVS